MPYLAYCTELLTRPVISPLQKKSTLPDSTWQPGISRQGWMEFCLSLKYFKSLPNFYMSLVILLTQTVHHSTKSQIKWTWKSLGSGPQTLLKDENSELIRNTKLNMNFWRLSLKTAGFNWLQICPKQVGMYSVLWLIPQFPL